MKGLASSLLARLLRLEAQLPRDAAVLRQIIEGEMPDGATTRDIATGLEMRRFVEAARHAHEGNARLRASDAVPALDSYDGGR